MDAALSPQPSSTSKVATVILVGNPNCGKTTLFNRLTGLTQKVGNYPGVTVEKKEGRTQHEGQWLRWIDLPGTYSLAAHSPDEMVAVDSLLGHIQGEPLPDVVVHVVDASNLERNLYLFSQIRELGRPVVLALTMGDIAERWRVRVDADRLSESLGVPVVPVRAHRGTGLEALKGAVVRAMRPRGFESGPAGEPREGLTLRFHDALHETVHALHAAFAGDFARIRGRELHPFEVLRAIVDRGGYSEQRLVGILGENFSRELTACRSTLNGNEPLSALESRLRYAWIREKLAGSLERDERVETTWSERLDRVLTHRFLGLLVFAVIMLVVFQSIFAWAAPIMDLIDGAFAALGGLVQASLPPGALRSLLVDGLIAGVGSVVIFLPQIIILFFFIGLLEDCGYMARAAFLMDKVMSKCGLSGKSFIPMLSGFACAIPGVMAARVIEDRRDRLATILVTPLMSCSARLPIYSIFIASFIPQDTVMGFLGLQAVTLFSLYVLGILVAVTVAWTLRKTFLRGPRAPFVLELPSYKWPVLSAVGLRLWRKAIAFLSRAGTIILAVSVVVWALSYFPHSTEVADRFEEKRAQAAEELAAGEPLASRLEEIDRLEEGEHLRQSYLGQMGRGIEPVFEPLGWDWRISVATLASFPAREIVVSVLGTIFNLGEVDEESVLLRDSLRQAERAPGQPLFTLPVALSILIFFALCCQCGATLATIKRETNSWRWPLFTFTYMTVLAYVGALLTYQIGSRL